MRAGALSTLRNGNFEDHSDASGENGAVVLRELVFGGGGCSVCGG